MPVNRIAGVRDTGAVVRGHDRQGQDLVESVEVNAAVVKYQYAQAAGVLVGQDPRRFLDSRVLAGSDSDDAAEHACSFVRRPDPCATPPHSPIARAGRFPSDATAKRQQFQSNGTDRMGMTTS
jgi:hypothetical protein